MNEKPLTERQAARQLAKALTEIKATSFQVRAASILLAVNGLQSAMAFVDDCRNLNEQREKGWPEL